MEDVAVVVIFAACVCLLLFAYLATTIRCSLWCRKGMKTDFSKPNNDDLAFSTVTILSANGLSIDDLKPAEPTKPEVVIVEPSNGNEGEQLYIVSIDICPDIYPNSSN
jgi:hypothetical protein